MPDLMSIYAPKNRMRMLLLAGAFIALVAVIDWVTKPYLSLGFLYLFPMIIVGGFLTRPQIVGVALVCSALQESFSNLPPSEAITRLFMASIGFIGTGLFVSEIIRKRQIALEHVEEVESQIKLRQEAEEQLRILVESSPAAIVTIDASGQILLANEAAQQLLAPGAKTVVSLDISEFLPALQGVVQAQHPRHFRTALQCRGRRANGEVFLAAAWFSTYQTMLGPRLAAIIVDLSEDLRDREDLSLDYLLKNARILMSAVSHEIRNLCGAVMVVSKNLAKLPALQNNEDFAALGTLIAGLEKLSSMELQPAGAEQLRTLEISSVLDELRILIEPAYQDDGIRTNWHVENDLPLVFGERYGLQQVFLNVTRNSQRAMQTVQEKVLTISTQVEPDRVVIRFEDSGTGIRSAENLFRPFQRDAKAAGLGLYVSRAILRSYRGDISFEPRERGCCFAVTLARVPSDDELHERSAAGEHTTPAH
ncbi:MAG TPA: ATP-binding protein [Terriglobales bacterium]|nr:ATP-binding protein [Terriglobales bacterium]